MVASAVPVGVERAVVHLLGGFGVSVAGAEIEVPASARRLLAFLALQGRPVERSYVSSCLWLDRREDRAQANLRSVLWRLRRCEVTLVTASASHIGLAVGVRVDVDDLLAAARELIDERSPCDLDAFDARDLAAELLPQWYDDFVELERERVRQICLHALESLARRLVRDGQLARGLEAALTAVAAEPLRESAHRAVIEVHLAEGNVSEAVRQYRCLAASLHEQLGIDPSERTEQLVRDQLRTAVVRIPDERGRRPGWQPRRVVLASGSPAPATGAGLPSTVEARQGWRT